MVVEAVVIAFVATQICYFAVNCGLCRLFVDRPTNVVDERTLGRVLEEATERNDRRAPRGRVSVNGGGGPESGQSGGAATRQPSRSHAAAADPEIEHGPGPRCRLPSDRCRQIRVLVPIFDEGWGPLEDTLRTIAAQSYPVSSLTVYVIYEPRETTGSELPGAIEPNRPPGLEVVPVEVDRESPAADRVPGEGYFTGAGASRTIAALLSGAFATRSFAEDDVVTVFDAGTQVPVDAFELAVAGLEEYDIVRAKRTVCNVSDGAIPLLESMASAARSDLCSATSSTGPSHPLGTAYFTEVGALRELDRWQLESGIEDVPLGMAARRRGYALGIVDRYVRNRCPTGVNAWVRRKRQRIRGPYEYLLARGWAGFDDVRFWTGPFLVQLLAVISVVGLPAATIVALLYASGTGVGSLSTPLSLVIGFNGLVWAYYSVRAYRAAWDAGPFKSRWHQLGYSVLSNPFTQALYAMLWAVPICLALTDAIRGETDSSAGSSHR